MEAKAAARNKAAEKPTQAPAQKPAEAPAQRQRQGLWRSFSFGKKGPQARRARRPVSL
jgi:endonuclease YncB( thermonuclease family)